MVITCNVNVYNLVHFIFILAIHKCQLGIDFFPLRVRSFSSVLQTKIEMRHEISNNVVCVTSKGSDQPAHMRSLIRAFASRLNVL